MFSVDDEVEIIADNYPFYPKRADLVGMRGIVEEIDEKGYWVSLFDLDDAKWYLCDESELKLVDFN